MVRGATKLVQLSEGEWISLKHNAYYRGGHQIPAEDGLVLIIEVCANDRAAESRLKKKISDEDLRIIREQLRV